MSQLSLPLRGLNGSGLSAPSRALGIDLGTTNSTVAEVVWDRAGGSVPRVRCLEFSPSDNTPGSALVPSIVALKDGQVVVGEAAKDLRGHPGGFTRRPFQNLFYDCKNDMGIRRTYHQAPEGFRTAPEIAGRVLEFLLARAGRENAVPPSRTVVTVPASFQSAQRRDTLLAATKAGLTPGQGDLLDEPVAAFLDHLFTFGLQGLDLSADPRKLLVFDFGGGTCDVTLLDVSLGAPGEGVRAASLAASRYCRLGGGDIDRAILHEILLPEFARQNGLDLQSFDYEEKKHVLEPSFLDLAETLKIGLCTPAAVPDPAPLAQGPANASNGQPTRDKFLFQPWVKDLHPLVNFLAAKFEKAVNPAPSLPSVPASAPNPPAPPDKMSLEGRFECCFRGETRFLNNPTLTREAFEKILRPFLERELPASFENEYRTTSSIFAPLRDALDRCGVRRLDVDAVLLAGGSSLIPQVKEALRSYFSNAAFLTYPDAHSAQTSVARGAAWHAFFLSAAGKPLVQSICHEGLSLRTASGAVSLIARGTALPFPGNPAGFAKISGLVVPVSAALETVKIRVEIVTSREGREVFKGLWTLPETVLNQGDPLALEFRCDDNQLLSLRLRVADGVDRPSFAAEIENPLTQMVNPGKDRLEILELEERLKTQALPPETHNEGLERLSDLYHTIGLKEKAIHFLKVLLGRKNAPSVFLLNKLALRFGDLGNTREQCRLYAAAAALPERIGLPLFNLALQLQREDRLDEALARVDEAIEREQDAPYFVLKGQLLRQKGDPKSAKTVLERALRTFEPVSSLGDWELSWCETAAHILEKSTLAKEAEAERIKRAQAKNKPAAIKNTGFLPVWKG